MDIVKFHKYAAILTMLIVILMAGLAFGVSIPENADEERAADKAATQFSQGALDTYLEVSEFIEKEVDKEVGGFYLWIALLFLFGFATAIISGSTVFFIHPRTISS